MTRILGGLVVLVLATASANAHFAFILPDSSGTSAQVIFSDDLTPDTKVDIEKLAAAKLTLRDTTGKESPLELKKGDGFYRATLPGSGPRAVYGVVDFGVRQKGDDKPFRLVYYPKALVGAGSGPAIGSVLKAEIVPATAAGKTRFQVRADGQPLADAEVTVLVPGEGKKAVKTDKAGFTPEFGATGRYGVYARYTEGKPGELAGMKFTETRHYATLVADIPQ